MAKRILIACSNYYPHSFGGTEVYVENHAQYLSSQGDKVSIITATPEDTFNAENTVYNDEYLTVCLYVHNGVDVYGCMYKVMDTNLLYSKEWLPYQQSWQNFISRLTSLQSLDILHIQSFTATIGLDLFRAVKALNPTVKVISSNHTPISCPKGTLMYQNTLTECSITPNVTDCTKCVLKTQQKLPYFLAKGINKLHLKHPRLPAILKTRHLVALHILAFKKIRAITDLWWCYSVGVKQILILNGIAAENIKMQRHGIDSFFLERTITKARDKTIFLFSGRLVEIKGINTLLSAWLKLPLDNHKELWLTAQPISQKAKTNNLLQQAIKRKDIYFLGEKTQKEIADIYTQVHFVIIPSECFEIGPLVFHEAIANQCNVICSDIGGCKELSKYYERGITIFETGNVTDLYHTLIKSSYTEVLRGNLTKSIREHFEGISL